MADNKGQPTNKPNQLPLKSESSGIYQQQTITAIPMPQQQNVFGPTQQPQVQKQPTLALSSIPLRPSMISQDTPFTEGGQTNNTITNLTKTLPNNIHSEQQQNQQIPAYQMQFPQMMPMPQFMPNQGQQNMGQGDGQNPMMNMMMPPGLPFNQLPMPMMPPMNNLQGMDPNQNIMLDQNMMQFQLQQQLQSISMMQASIMQLGQQLQQQDFQLPQQLDGQNNSRRPSTMSGMTNMSQMQNDNISGTQPFPYNQIGNQNRPKMVPSIDMKKLQEQQAMMASMPSNNSKQVTPGGHTNFSQFSASHMMNQPIQFDLTQGQMSQVNGASQINPTNLRQLQQNNQSNDESPMNKFSRDSQNILSSSKKFSANKKPLIQDDNIDTPNQYELSSKKNSSETVGLLGGPQSSSKQYNLSPDGPDTQLKQIQEQEPITSEDEDPNLDTSNNHPKNNSKMPAFDSSPINEDDEYDKIQYQPTPQFIFDQKLGGYSGRGLDRQGSAAGIGTAKRMVSGESMQTILKVPGGVSKKKVQEVDIDGELVSKVSKANLTGNAQPYYPGEVQQNPMNTEFHNELDEFLMDQEEEMPKIDDSKENFVNILKLSNKKDDLQIEQIQSATKITNTKELKELDGLVMDKSTKLIDLEQNLEKSKDSLRLPPVKSKSNTSRKSLTKKSQKSGSEVRIQKSKFNQLRIEVKKNQDSNSDQDQSANMLRHDKSLSSHKFSEYNEDIFKPNNKHSSGNAVDQFLNLQSTKKSKLKKPSSPSALDFNDLVDKQSVGSKRPEKDVLIHVKSSSSSSLQHMASIAIIDTTTPQKESENLLQISKYNSAQPSKTMAKKRQKGEDSPEKPQTIQSSRKSHSVGNNHKEFPKIDIDLVESQKSKDFGNAQRSNDKLQTEQSLPPEIENLEDQKKEPEVYDMTKQPSQSLKLDVIQELATPDIQESPGDDDNKKQLEFLLQQIQLMQTKAEELQQRLGSNEKDASKPIIGHQYSQSSLFVGLKDSSPETKSPVRTMMIKNVSLPPSSKQSPAVNKKLKKSTSKISSEGSTIGIQNHKRLSQKFNSQSYQQMNSRTEKKMGDQSYEISESINASNGAELLHANTKLAQMKQELPDQIKETESEKNSSEFQKSGWKNSVILQPKLKLKNTASTQNFPTSKDSYQQRDSVITIADQTPVQTYRPDLKTNEKLQNQGQYQAQSKSYNKDEVLLQLISAEQTYQKINNSKLRNHQKENNQFDNQEKAQQISYPQNLVEEQELLSPTTLEANQGIQPEIKIIRRHVEQDDKNEAINRKFNRIFGTIFKGYNRKMQYKFEEKKFQIHQAASKKRQDYLLQDFEDVIQYTTCVNRNVCKALSEGVFQKQIFIGNLMHEEDQYFFSQQSNLSPILQKTQTDHTESQFDISQILKIQNIKLKNQLLQKHLDNRARKQILLTNEDLFDNNFTHQTQFLLNNHSSLNLSVKHLFIDNKRRRQRLEAKKKHAEILLKEERDKYMHQHQERQLKIEIEKEERKERVEMRIRKMSLERQVKQKMWKEQRRVHHSLVNKKPLYKRLQENLKIQEEKYEESRDNFLKARRSQFKPIIKEQLEDFAEKIDIIAGHLKMKKREERSKLLDNDSFDPNRLKSKIYMNVVSQDKISRQKSEVEFKKKNDLIAKKQNYANYIKMVHQPAANEQKQAELKSRIESLKHPVKGQFKYPPGIKLAQLSQRSGINYESEFLNRRNSSRMSIRQTNTRNSKSQQTLPLISSVDTEVPSKKDQNISKNNFQSQIKHNRSQKQVSLKDNQRNSSLAHLEQYEENKFIKKKQKAEEQKKDYIQEMRLQRQSKELKKKASQIEMSALEKLNQLEADTQSDKFGENIEIKEERWL